MRWSEFFVIAFFVLVVFFSFLVYFIYFQGDEVSYEFYNTDKEFNVSGNIQFHTNMRYIDRRISYGLEENCNLGKIADAEKAFSILGNKTILEFYRVYENADITILCSKIAPEADEESHFIAGEGGPSEVISSGEYSVILSGKVSLFRVDDCDSPQIALHEILHALGFDHNADKKSILYPVTGCKQEIDEYIIENIDSLYSVEPKADLIITEANASRTGRYLDFRIVISNFGLKDVGSSELNVLLNEESIRKFDLKELEIGTQRTLSVENVRLPFRKVESIGFRVEYEGEELSKSNNFLILDVE